MIVKVALILKWVCLFIFLSSRFCVGKAFWFYEEESSESWLIKLTDMNEIHKIQTLSFINGYNSKSKDFKL